MRDDVVRKTVMASLIAATIVSLPTAATADEAPRESAARDANRGLHVGLGPVLLLPSDGGPIGGGAVLGARYGIDAGPTVIAPGGLLSGYVISARAVGIAMPTVRVTLPAGPLAPFVVGGVGGGWMTNPGDGGVALLGGGGLMIHFGRVLGIGAEATYQTITGTELQTFVIGPSIVVGG